MKYIIDNSNLYAGGGIQVGTSFINDLNKLNLPNEYHIIQSFNMSKSFVNVGFPDNFKFYNLDEKSQKSIRFRSLTMRRLENIIAPDCIFTVFGPSYHKSKFPKVVGFAIGHIIYRDSPYFKTLNIREKFKNFLTCEIKKIFFKKNSDALIFETNDAMSRFENISKFKENYVVGNTINEIFLESSKWESVFLRNENKKKILVVAANYPHKNLKIIPFIIDNLITQKKIHDFEFVITVEPEELSFPDCYNDYIQCIGKVSLEKLPSLYKQSMIVFIPTLLEIFSATYLEAMYMSKAIVASDMGFSRDICGDAALYCEPINIDEYANAIFTLLGNAKLRHDFEKKGLSQVLKFGSSMDRTKMYLDIMHQVSEEF
ncbi:glycosyltransferase [Acinetobacter beijerinckii]|uniref:Glycosyl transferase family 1 domain-containing protein n=1 Tax=Acinetobacter beijerinckii CIP 110307 TaxID=1217648 RepID=N9E6S9_9GAMM|nr:glycosyltransferase [Acinetobacter beijerinckii]ENW06163.1 hypothetical protein F933_01884 [Acinetobacter beijerinckii CIP 110307]